MEIDYLPISSGATVCHYQREMERGLPGSKTLSFLSSKMTPSCKPQSDSKQAFSTY